jgi:prepilin-type N-terminal cleavage/methylation domain-containing protein
MKKKESQGFTLLEISVVLVIIGLIVGGVLVGQDMIKTASLRATVSQYQKYNTAVYTFRGKFGGIPGDIAGADAVGLDAFTVPAPGLADGNGLLQGDVDFPIGAAFGELLMFWRQLGQANLIDGSYGMPGTPNEIDLTEGTVKGTVDTADKATGSFPLAKVGNNNFFTVFSDAGVNYFQIVSVSSMWILR